MSATALKDRPVFICGHPKSGTSMLRNLLDHHPQLVVYPEESVFFRRYLPESAGLSGEALFDLALRRLVHIFEWNIDHPPAHQEGFPDRDYTEVSFEEISARLKEKFTAEELRHPGDMLAMAVLTFGEVTGYQLSAVSGWVEKTPGNEGFASQVFEWWPEARCLHIVRDPLDNFASYQRKQTSWTPGKFSTHWNRSTRTGFENSEKFGPARYRLLRYEDLVSDPEASMEEICQFLGIESHPNLFRPTRMGKPWRGNSMFGDQFEAISPVAVGRWKEKLTSSEVGIVQAATGHYRRRLDYRDQAPVEMGDRLTGLLWRLRGQFYDLRQGLKGKR